MRRLLLLLLLLLLLNSLLIIVVLVIIEDGTIALSLLLAQLLFVLQSEALLGLQQLFPVD